MPTSPSGDAVVRAASLIPSIVLKELCEGGSSLSHGSPTGPDPQAPFQATIVQLRVRGWEDEFSEITPPEGAGNETIQAFRGDVETISRGLTLFFSDIMAAVHSCGGDLLSFDGSTATILFDTRVAVIDTGDTTGDSGNLLGGFDDDDESSASGDDDSHVEAMLAVDCAVRLLKQLNMAPSERYHGAALDFGVAVCTGRVIFTHVGADEHDGEHPLIKRGSWGFFLTSPEEDGPYSLPMQLDTLYKESASDIAAVGQPCIVVSDDVWKEVQGSYKEVNQVSGDYHIITLRDVLAYDAPGSNPWPRRVIRDVEGRVSLYAPGRSLAAHMFRSGSNAGRDHCDKGVVIALRVRREGSRITPEDMQLAFSFITSRANHMGAVPCNIAISENDPTVIDAIVVGVPPGQGESKVVNRMPHYAIDFIKAFDELAKPTGLSVTGAIGHGWSYRRALATPFPKSSVINTALTGSVAARRSLWTSRSAIIALGTVIVDCQRLAMMSEKPIALTVKARDAVLERKNTGLSFEAAPEHISAEVGMTCFYADAATPEDIAVGVRSAAKLPGSIPPLKPIDPSGNASKRAGGGGVKDDNIFGAASGSGATGTGKDNKVHPVNLDTARGGDGDGDEKPESAPGASLADRFSYGKIHFVKENRFAEYVVAPNDNDIGDDFLYWLIDFWKLDMPKMLISITGGATNWHRAPYTIKFKGGPEVRDREETVKMGTSWDQVFGHSEKDKMNEDLLAEMHLFESKVSQLFSRGICRAAVKARAWILTGGSSSGVMQLAGHGIRDNQFGTACIGLLTYDMLNDREIFRNTPAQVAARKQGKEYDFRVVNVHPPPVKPVPGICYLEPNHTHFVMVETGVRKFGGEVRFRFQIEQDLVSLVPAVLVIANGGPNTVSTVIESVRQARPIIVIKGTGRFADNLSVEYAKKKAEREANKAKALAKLRIEIQQREKKRIEKEQRRRIREKQKRKLMKMEKNKAKANMAKLEATIGESGATGTQSRRRNEARNRRNGRDGNGSDEEIETIWAEADLLESDDESAADELGEELGELADDDVGAGGDNIKTIEFPVVSEFVHTDDHLLAEIVSDGDLYVFDLEKDPLTTMDEIIVQSLFKQPMPEERNTRLDREALNYAWRDFARYDTNAKRAKVLNVQFMYTVLLLNLIGTLLAVVQQQLRNDGRLTTSANSTLQTMIIIVPLVTGITLSIQSRFNPLVRWLVLRGAAERVRAAIYLYRVRHESYQGINANGDSRMLKMQQTLDEIQQAIFKTEVNQSSVVDPGKMYKFEVAEHEKDRFSMLMPDQYYKYRVLRELAYYRRKTPLLEKQLRSYQFVIYVISGGSALLGTFGAELWVAATTAVVSALTTLLEYNQVQTRLMKYNSASAELSNIRTWWKALSAVEKASPVLMKSLVDSTESVLSNELASWVQAAKAEDKKEDEDEDELPDVQRMRNPKQYAKDRAAEIYNQRYGPPKFPIRPGSIKE